MLVAKAVYTGLDRFKIIAALLVIAIHTGPLTSWSVEADFVLTSVVARVAGRPFFLMAAGFLLFRKLMNDHGKDPAIIHRYCARIGLLYAISTLIYIPINIYAGKFDLSIGVVAFCKMLLLDGTFYHLWFLPALITGIYIVYLLSRFVSPVFVVVITILLYFVGLRNGLFFAPIFIALGWLAARGENERSVIRTSILSIIFIALLVLVTSEAYAVRMLGWPRLNNMYLSLVPIVYVMFLILIRFKGTGGKLIRELSIWIYILHPMAINIVRGASKVTNLQSLFVTNSLVHYIAVSILSILMSFAVIKLIHKINISKQIKRTKLPEPLLADRNIAAEGNMAAEPNIAVDRAWADIRLDRLAHNVNELKRVLPKTCEMMAVIKADAYGHGSLGIARHLNKLGIRRFAVAHISEAIALRTNHIQGEILVLGYTSPGRFAELEQYDLSQTMISAEYGEILGQYGRGLKTHVKIDTGMRRLGENCDRLDRIRSMYKHRDIQIIGTYSHLASADCLDEKSVAYTRLQLDRFDRVITALREEGIDPGSVHIQSSYGILNIPDVNCDIARPGIALFGMPDSQRDAMLTTIDLRPVLELKAIVTHVKAIAPDETVGYGTSSAGNFQNACSSERLNTRKIATVSIGYADGLPRQWYDSGGYVLIRGHRAPIAGKICMDQIMVDVTDIPEVRTSDIVTLIGQDGEEVITAGDMATACGTITNEIVSRIGVRVKRKVIDS